jgi:hypothetical protein
VQKGAGDVPSTSTSIDERQRVAWRSQEATTEPKAQEGQDTTPPKAASTTTDTPKQMDIDQKSIEKKDKLVKENGKDKETNEFERVVERNKAKGKEEKQNLRNVGVAVLVIVALGFGGYASYRYSSSAKPEKK